MKPQQPSIVVLTGAGISRESGLQTFRDSDGLWYDHRIEDVATPEGWARDPDLVLNFYNERRRQCLQALPNEGHLALAKLEAALPTWVITQNIDDLHERAGSQNVVHLHGEILIARGERNSAPYLKWVKDISLGDLAPDGTQLRPHVVWFGEAVPEMDRAVAIAEEADILVVIGTSLQVYPAASLAHVARRARKFLIDPNPPQVDESNVEVIREPASTGVPKLVERLLRSF